jgi:hypothetical protein
MFFLANTTVFTNVGDIPEFSAKVYVLLEEENQDAGICSV